MISRAIVGDDLDEKVFADAIEYTRSFFRSQSQHHLLTNLRQHPNNTVKQIRALLRCFYLPPEGQFMSWGTCC